MILSHVVRVILDVHILMAFGINGIYQKATEK